MEEEHMISLKAIRSALKSQSSYARVHSVIHEHLMMDEKDHIEVVNKDNKAILVRIVHDTLVGKDEIRLGPKDMENGGLNDGDEVNVWATNPNVVDSDSDGLSDGDEVRLKVHKTIMDSAADLKDKIVSKLKKKEEDEKGDE